MSGRRAKKYPGRVHRQRRDRGLRPEIYATEEPLTRKDDFSDLEEALSLERFGRYLAWSHGDRHQAIRLYTLNTKVSESLYTPLQMLEVALRNRIHRVLVQTSC